MIIPRLNIIPGGRDAVDGAPSPDPVNQVQYLKLPNLTDLIGNMNAVDNGDGTYDFHPTTNNNVLYEKDYLGHMEI